MRSHPASTARTPRDWRCHSDMQVSFIIPLYNCLALTQECLRTLQATLPAGLTHEIILVDDGSTDGTREWLAGLWPLKGLPGLNYPAVCTSDPALSPVSPCRVFLHESNRGFAATCNRGAAEAQGEVLFFLNNDLVFQSGWFQPMLAAFTRFSRAGLVGNVQLNHASGAIDHAGVFFNHKGKPEHRISRGWAWRSYRPVLAVTGACLALRRATWRQLGGFDVGYHNGCEDVDLALRAQETGLTNYVALPSVVRHHISASIGRKARDEQNTARLVSRWRTVIIPRIARHCSRACLQASWDEPRNFPDIRLVVDAFFYSARLLPLPPAAIMSAANASLELELARWANLLAGAPDKPVRELAWQFFPKVPENPPVI